MSTKNNRFLLLVLWIVPCLSSCSVATAPAVLEAGRDFPWTNVPAIKEEMEASEVQRLLGEPFLTEQVGGQRCWLYYCRTRQQDIIRVLGVIPRKKTFSYWEREVTLCFEDDRVESVSAEERDLLQE